MPTMNIEEFKHGLNNRQLPFNIPDDAFSQLVNAYVFRGNVLKKPGTKLLTRLALPLTSPSLVALDSSGDGSFNFLTMASMPAGASIKPGTISLSDGTNTYTDASDGVITGSPGGSGSVNYATGVVSISGGASDAEVSGTCTAYPALPVMGIAPYYDATGFSTAYYEQFIFDTSFAYSYATGTSLANSSYQSSANLCRWHGESYQLFSCQNASGAFFATNGVAGFQFKKISAITLGITSTITIADHGLVVNDVVWFNEVYGATGFNGQTATVTEVVDANTFVVSIDSSGFGAYTGGGICQYLTSSAASPSADGIRYYYEGGWVNYAPPYIAFSTASDAAPVRYIVGANKILLFKGRLILFGVYTGSSEGDVEFSGGELVYSDIGSPFYTALNPDGADGVNEGAFYFAPAGTYGGFISLQTNEAISSAMLWLESVLVEFASFKIRLLSTNSPLVPFIYEFISNEYGGLNKESVIAFNNGIVSASVRGFIMTSTTGCVRLDDDIPDMVYAISKENHGLERVIAQRDYQRETLYFTFPNARNNNLFPDTTLVYNYFDKAWAQFSESFCCYGTLYDSVSTKWSQMTQPWYTYTQSWNSFGLGAELLLYCGGNQQGFVLERDSGSGSAEDYSLQISAISGSTLTVYNHNLEAGDYIYIYGCLGSTNLNGSTYMVASITDIDTIVISGTGTGEYLGGGVIAVQRGYYIQTKAFNFGWDNHCTINVSNVRLLTNLTPAGVGQYSLVSFANTDTTQPVNVATPQYSPLVLGSMATAPNTVIGLNNEQIAQQQIWVRTAVNTQGFCVQFALGLSPSQMLSLSNTQAPFELCAVSFDWDYGAPFGS